MRVLLLGDSHIPTRAYDFPPWVKDFIEREWDLILHTGDVEEGFVLAYLEQYGRVVAVRGNMDRLPLPEEKVVDLPWGRALLIHGHQVRSRGNWRALAEKAKRLGAGTVITGHTHRPFLGWVEDVLVLNPGTATGAWGGSYEGGEESFITIEDRRIVLYINGEERETLII